MIPALLLAAGQGSRMQNQPKALLTLAGRSFVAHALQQLREAAFDDIVLVTGAEQAAVWAAAAPRHAGLREAYNPDFRTGLMSSIQCGLRQLPAASEAVLITLVDLPFLTAEDYRTVREAWRQRDGKTLVRAQSAGRPGHPVLIPRAYFAEILQQPPSDRGCAFLFQKYAAHVHGHELPRGSIDIDTREDYHAHITP